MTCLWCRSEGSEADEGGEAIAKLQRMVDAIKEQAQRDKARKRQAIIKARCRCPHAVRTGCSCNAAPRYPCL